MATKVKASAAEDPTAKPRQSPAIETPATIASYADRGIDESESLTWRDFDPVGGMPPKATEFTPAEINEVFGCDELDAEMGNYVLNVMHYRRMSGSIINDGLLFPKDTGVKVEQAKKALDFLRTLVPDVDEQQAAATWADEEAAREEAKLIERSQELGLYKKIEPEQKEISPEEEQGTEYGRARSGESSLIAMRKSREAQYEQEKAQKAKEEERQANAELAAARGPLELNAGVQPSTTLAPGGQSVKLSRARNEATLVAEKRKERLKYYEDQAQIIKDHAVPQMSTLRRLGPSALFAFAVVTLAIFLSNNYTPPPKSARMFPDTPPSVATLSLLTGLILTSFVASRFPPLWRTYSKYFTLVPAYPWAVSTIGSIFRHDYLSSMLPNLAALWIFGLMLHEDVGRGTFIAMFFATGAVGGFVSLSYSTAIKGWTHYISGSSNAVLGVLAASCTFHPNNHLSILGYEIPVSAWLFLALYSVGEIYAIVKMKGTSNLDHAGHLGGILSGILGALWLRGKQKGEEREEAKENLERAVNTLAQKLPADAADG